MALPYVGQPAEEAYFEAGRDAYPNAECPHPEGSYEANWWWVGFRHAEQQELLDDVSD